MDERATLLDSIPAKCARCEVRCEGLCAALDLAQLAQVDRAASRRRIRAGTEIFFEGDELTRHINVMEGVVQLSKTSPDGSQQIVSLQFSPKTIIVTREEAATVTAQAATDVEICSIPSSIIDAMATHSPEIKRRMLAQILRDLDQTREWLLIVGRKKALERVASFILMVLAQYDPLPRDGSKVTLPLSRSAIADFLGLTIETVCRNLTKLRAMSVIRVENDRDIQVLRIRQLKAIANARSSE